METSTGGQEVGNAEFDRFREKFEAQLQQDPTYRAMKPVDPTWLLGYLPVDRSSGVASGIDVVTADGVSPMVWLTGWRYIVGRLGGEHRGVSFDPTERVVMRPGAYTGPPIIDGYLVTSPAVFGTEAAAPPIAAYAPGADGVGPALDGENGPVQWILLDGYAYHVSDADSPGRFQVRELRPQRDDALDVSLFE
jgi:hypothetical protein